MIRFTQPQPKPPEIKSNVQEKNGVVTPVFVPAKPSQGCQSCKDKLKGKENG